MPVWTRRRDAALLPFSLREIRMSDIMVRVLTEPANHRRVCKQVQW